MKETLWQAEDYHNHSTPQFSAAHELLSTIRFKGGIGVFELLVMDNKLRALIVQNPVFEAIYAQALANGMQTLLHDASQKLAAGVITLQELVRVIL
jgi:type II secretory ATPase GspE/PulE/Tfp pilus assembly ATPase PilB-like protein